MNVTVQIVLYKEYDLWLVIDLLVPGSTIVGVEIVKLLNQLNSIRPLFNPMAMKLSDDAEPCHSNNALSFWL